MLPNQNNRNAAKIGGIVEVDFEIISGLFLKDTCWKCVHTLNWQIRNERRCEQYGLKPFEVFYCGEKCPNFQQVESIEGQPENIKELENKIEELRRIIPQEARFDESFYILYIKGLISRDQLYAFASWDGIDGAWEVEKELNRIIEKYALKDVTQ